MQQMLNCQFCQATFQKMSKLNRHIEETHRQLRNYGCLLCFKSFKRQSHLDRHQLSHTKLKPQLCHYPECGMRFNYKHHLKRHIAIVHEAQTISCQFCQEVFRKKIQMIRHNIQKHGIKSPYQCLQCGYLRKHQCTEPEPISQSQQNNLTLRVCGYSGCGKAFLSWNGFKSHQESHLNK